MKTGEYVGRNITENQPGVIITPDVEIRDVETCDSIPEWLHQDLARVTISLCLTITPYYMLTFSAEANATGENSGINDITSGVQDRPNLNTT